MTRSTIRIPSPIRSLFPLPALAVALALGLASAAAAGPVVKTSDRSFDRKVLSAELPVLVAFGAPWCLPCKRLEEHLEDVADERREELVVAEINASSSDEVAKRYGVSKLPTLVLFRGGDEVARATGVQSRETLDRFLERSASRVAVGEATVSMAARARGE